MFWMQLNCSASVLTNPVWTECEVKTFLNIQPSLVKKLSLPSHIILFGREYSSNCLQDEDIFVDLLKAARYEISKFMIPKLQGKLKLLDYENCKNDVTKLLELLNIQINGIDPIILNKHLNILEPLFRPSLYIIDKNILCITNNQKNMYHYFHGHLEWRWLNLLGKFALKNDQPEKSVSVYTIYDFDQEYDMLMYDLMKLSVCKFILNCTEYKCLIVETPFICSCVEKLWIGMLSVSSQEYFWNCYEKNLERFLNDKDVYDEFGKERRPNVDTNKKYKSQFLYHPWLINGIAQLCQTKLNDTMNFTNFENYGILNSIAKLLLDPIDRPEEQIRIALLLMKPIFTNWWKLDFTFILQLWEYFKYKLNDTFNSKNADYGAAIVNTTTAGLLENIKKLILLETLEHSDRNDTSFSMFISMSAFLIKDLVENNMKYQIKKIFTRVIVRFGFGPDGVLANLTENGVYNVGSLFAMLVEVTNFNDDYNKISNIMLNLMQLQFNKFSTLKNADINLIIDRIRLITLTNMVLLIQFSEKNYDKSSHMKKFFDIFDETFRRRYGYKRLMPALNIFADAMIKIYEISTEFNNGEELFIGPWLTFYLDECGIAKQYKVLQSLNNILKVLKENNTYVKNRIMVLERFYTHLLKFVKDAYAKNEKPDEPLGEIASNLCLLAPGVNGMPSFQALFKFFEENDSANVCTRLHFIKSIAFSDKSNDAAVGEALLIRNWIKFAVLTSGSVVRDFTKVICRYNKFLEVCDVAEYDLMESNDPIVLVIKSMGNTFHNIEEKDIHSKVKYQQKIYEFFVSIDKWNKKADLELLKRIYSILVLAIKECGRAVYSRTSVNCLYHSAFRCYFLPQQILSENPEMSVDHVKAMISVWHKLIDGISCMGYTKDPVMLDHLNKLVIKWTPLFDKVDNSHLTATPYLNLLEIENVDVVKLVYRNFIKSFIEMQGQHVPKRWADVGMKIFKEILLDLYTKKSFESLKFFLNIACQPILHHAMNCNDHNPSKPIAYECVHLMFKCGSCESESIRNEVQGSLKQFTLKCMMHEAGFFFLFITTMAKSNPTFVKSMLPLIKYAVDDAEGLIGLGRDVFLRTHIATLEGALTAFEMNLKQ